MCAFFIIFLLQVLGSGFMFASFLIKMYSTYEIVHNLCLSVPNSVGYYVRLVGVYGFVKKICLFPIACISEMKAFLENKRKSDVNFLLDLKI